MTKQQLIEAFDSGLKSYSKEYTGKMYDNPIEQLRQAEMELEEVRKLDEEVKLKAKRHATRMLYACFSVCATQLGGMGYLIFGLYDWEVMEPITYMVCKLACCLDTNINLL